MPNEGCLAHLLAIQPIALNAPECAAEMNEMHSLQIEILQIVHLTRADR